MDTMKQVTIAILAGGGSHRIPNKPLLNFQGKPLLTHVIQRISHLSSKIVLVLRDIQQRKNLDSIIPSGIEIVYDLESSVPSPLVGIVSALKSIETPYLLVLPCDAPFPSVQLLKYLISLIPNHGAVVPRWPNGWIEPLHSIYDRQLAFSVFKKYLPVVNKRLIHIIKEIPNTYFVSTNTLRKFDPELLTFLNINTSQDLEKADAIISLKHQR